ncbi:MAG: iron ABC transporter permease [Corticimicrobacter sp.]|uniref:FecCD family ABC transporter permease n=1 Tax=Corticimicrobacter sp. TaxID=2678536 RepID=UPI0032DA6A74
MATAIPAESRHDPRSAGIGRVYLPVLLAVLLVGAAFAMSVGHYPVTASTVLDILVASLGLSDTSHPASVVNVVMAVRLPRVLAAITVGAALAAAGVAYQALFRNPLASPALLGVSSGAGFGACAAMLLQAGALGIQTSAFAGGLAAVGLALLIANHLGRGAILILVLSGLVVSALFQALTSSLKYLADPLDTLPAMVFWLLGSLAQANRQELWLAIPLVLLGLLILLLLRWPTQVMEVGEDEARMLGIRVGLVRLLVIIAATLITAAAVSLAGIVGWVGLLVPHLTRLLVGPAYPRLLPMTILMGAAYLLLVDTICRSAFASELPLGVATAVIGAPVFIIILMRARRQWH